MKVTGNRLALILLAALMIPIAGAQDTTPKPAAPKPALGPSQTLLQVWNDVGRKLTAMAEDFPKTNTISNPIPFSAALPSNLSMPPMGTTSSSTS